MDFHFGAAPGRDFAPIELKTRRRCDIHLPGSHYSSFTGLRTGEAVFGELLWQRNLSPGIGTGQLPIDCGCLCGCSSLEPSIEMLR